MRSSVASFSRCVGTLVFGIAVLFQARVEAQGFGAPVLVPTSKQPVFVATADVNADGIPDLIYIDAGATPTASTTHVLLADGKGGFKESAAIATAGVSVAVGNLLGKGHVDIGWLTSSQTAYGIFLVWHVAGGAGDGTFAAPVTGGPQSGIGTPGLPQFGFTKAAEIKGQANTVAQIVGVDTANGYLFSIPIEIDGLTSTSTQLLHGAGAVTLSDLNGDSYDDILIDGQTDFTEQIFLGTPTNTGKGFEEVIPGFFSGTTGVHSVAVQDFNGDGKPDLAVEGASGRIDVFAGNGDGTFGSSSIGGTTSVDSSKGDGGYLIAAADLNGDGRPDLLTYTPLGVSVLLGTASGNFTLSGTYPVGAGTHSSWVTADFNGDGFLDVAVDTPGGIAILYGQAATGTSPGVVSATPNPVGFEAAYSLIATMAAGTGPGTVSFSVDGAGVGSALVMNEKATLPVAAVPPNTGGKPLLPGSHALAGTYLKTDSALAVQLTGGTLVVNKAPETPVLTPTPPQTVYFGGPVNGTVAFPVQDDAYPPTSSWTLTDNGYAPSICIDIPIGYQPGCPYGYPMLLNAGVHSFVITYNGDAVNAVGSSAPYAYTVLPDPTAVAINSLTNPAAVGTSVTFQARVSVMSPGILTETPQGLVTFMDGTTVLATEALDTNALAGFSTSSLSAGTHAITVSYAALPLIDPSQTSYVYNWAPSVSPVLRQVIGAAPLGSVVTLQSSLNPSGPAQMVTFTAGVSVPGPFVDLVQSGTVTFLDGTTVIGTGTINKLGMAVFSTSALATGSHAMTASYPGGMAGAQTIEPSVSPVLTQVVTNAIVQAPPGFVLTVTPNPTWVPAGQTATLQVTVRAVSGFAAPVTLSCSGAPGESTCGLVITTIPAGGGSTTLQIATTAPHACGDPTHPYTKGGVAGLQAPACSGRGERVSGREVRGLELGGPLLAGLILLVPRRRRRVLVCLVMLVGFVGLNGCGTCTDLGTPLGSYTVTVTGTAAGASQSVAVKLTVLPQ